MGAHLLADAAIRDLNDIWDYYDAASGTERADAILADLGERFRLLADNPYIGVSRSQFAPDMRSYATRSTPYLIFYFPREYGVEIVRVLHGRRDLASILTPPP